MSTTRLRKAFRYPDDSGDDEQGREELDEEEQDVVIRQLQAENDQRNSEYTIIFSVIPLLAATIYVPPTISSSSTLSERLRSMLSVISLLLTAYIMKYHAIERPDPKGKRPITKADLITSAEKYAIPTNAALCALLALTSIMASPTAVVTYFIPAAILATILIARKVMASVDISDERQHDWGSEMRSNLNDRAGPGKNKNPCISPHTDYQTMSRLILTH